MSRRSRKRKPTRKTARRGVAPVKDTTASPVDVEEGTDDRAVSVSWEQSVAMSFSGPLPPPKHFAAYDSVVPGAADRILKMAEEQADHRRHLENEVVMSELKLKRRGQVLAFVITMTALAGGIGAMMTGASLSGAAVCLLALASVVGLFWWGGRREKQNADAAILARHKPSPIAPPSPPRKSDL